MTNFRCKIRNSIVLFSLFITVVFGLLGSISNQVSGQTQPSLSAEQFAALKEAEQLDERTNELYEQGQYSAAIPLAQKVLAIREQVLGSSHIDVAQSLNSLALLYEAQGKYQQAEPLYQRSLTISEKALGKSHPDVATVLNNLAELYRLQGKYQQAEPLYQRSLAIREQVLGNLDTDVAQSLNNIALLYEAQGKYQQAEVLYQRSLAISEKVLGQSHPDIATTLSNLATLYRVQGKYQKAEPLYQRSLAIREQALGKSHPDYAVALNSLALLYEVQGKYQQAEALYQRSLVISEKTLGNSHPDVANALNNLAELYRLQRSYQKAETLYQRSLAISEKTLGNSHPNVAITLNNLAALYQAQGNYQKAESLYQRSLSIIEKALGKENPDVASSLNNLAALYQAQKKYQQAEVLYQRSLAISEKALGNLHPDVASSINNLALLYATQGKYQQAEPLYQRSLLIRENVLGKSHPDVAQSLNNLALLYEAQGDIPRSIDFSKRRLEVEEQNLNLIFFVGSEQRKQDYARIFRATTYSTISLSLQDARNNPVARQLALTTILRRKGRVLDAMTDSIQILRTQVENKPEARKLFDEWVGVLQQQSALISRKQGKQTPEQYKARFEELEAEKQRLEESISTVSAEFRTENQPVEIKDIQAKIPKDAALVEVVQYNPYNAKAKKQNEEWGKPRYAAAVLRSSFEPKLIDLGDALAIDKSVSSLREALAARRNIQSGSDEEQTNLRQVHQLARVLDKQVMAPIRPLLGNAQHILLSPDGQLNLVPFEALRDEQGQYLIQRYAFSYLTTGRDLLRVESTAYKLSAPLVLANINYDDADATTIANDVRGIEQHSSDLANTPCCSPLQNTKEEALAIQNIMPNAQVLFGSAATKAALRQVNAPSILHIATHGFFFPDQEKYLRAPGLNADVQNQEKVLRLENPLLRSGLALAGFNNRNNRNPAPDPANDGVLTALETTGLNLRGTKLVVLSACETGLGDVKVGDGVYGLRRALVIAGSQSQLFTLWRVSDSASKELMVTYYQNLKHGKDRHEALRKAQLEMLKTSYYQHPYFWAGYIPSGDWTPLLTS